MQEPKETVILSESEKKELINKLANELSVLRAKAGIAQDELSKLIGVSRQTYGAIERKNKDMSWETYLALIFYFEHNNLTRQLLKQTNIYPEMLIERINEENGTEVLKESDMDGFPMLDMIESLDEQGIHSLKTLLMVEYARCQNLPGDYVVKAFNGKEFNKQITDDDKQISRALRAIKEKRK